MVVKGKLRGKSGAARPRSLLALKRVLLLHGLPSFASRGAAVHGCTIGCSRSRAAQSLFMCLVSGSVLQGGVQLMLAGQIWLCPFCATKKKVSAKHKHQR